MKVEIEKSDSLNDPNEFWVFITDGEGENHIATHAWTDINSLEKLSMALDSIIEGRSESEVIEL
jgi:hypothetical protein